MSKQEKSRRKDDTIYIIEFSTSDSAKETAFQKIERLIMNESITLDKKVS